MANFSQLNKALYGLTEGLGQVGSGFMQKHARTKAEEYYNKTRSDYDKIAGLRTNAIDVINNYGKLGTPQEQGGMTGTGNTPNLQQQGEYQNALTGNQSAINKLYSDIQQQEGRLAQNPYGQKYQDLITKFYETKDDIKAVKLNSGDFMINYTKGTAQKIGEKSENWQMINGTDGTYLFNPKSKEYQKIGEKPIKKEKADYKTFEEDGYKVNYEITYDKEGTPQMKEISRNKIRVPHFGLGNKKKQKVFSQGVEKSYDLAKKEYDKYVKTGELTQDFADAFYNLTDTDLNLMTPEEAQAVLEIFNNSTKDEFKQYLQDTFFGDKETKTTDDE